MKVKDEKMILTPEEEAELQQMYEKAKGEKFYKKLTKLGLPEHSIFNLITTVYMAEKRKKAKKETKQLNKNK